MVLEFSKNILHTTYYLRAAPALLSHREGHADHARTSVPWSGLDNPQNKGKEDLRYEELLT